MKVFNALLCRSMMAIALISGCSSAVDRGALEGKVRSGNQPLGNVLVTFFPDSKSLTTAVRASGMTDDTGYFQLKTEDQQTELPVGNYRVIVEDMSFYTAPRAQDGTLRESVVARFSTIYRDPLKTPLRQSVESGSQTIQLELRSR